IRCRDRELGRAEHAVLDIAGLAGVVDDKVVGRGPAGAAGRAPSELGPQGTGGGSQDAARVLARKGRARTRQDGEREGRLGFTAIFDEPVAVAVATGASLHLALPSDAGGFPRGGGPTSDVA